MEQLKAKLALLSLSSKSSSLQQPPATSGLAPPAPPPSSNATAPTQHSTNLLASGVPQTGFVPPLTTNSASGTSEIPYLDHPFPHVNEATINAIITHTFNPYHLWKLNPHHQEKNQKRTLQLVGASLKFASDETALKDFKEITSLMVPLQVYFKIIIHYVPPLSAAALSKLFFHPRQTFTELPPICGKPKHSTQMHPKTT
ncbi:hypothetical protein H1R20_g4506, partial [Candolleomyces eurysporus]